MGSKLPHIVAMSQELDRLWSIAALYGHIGEFVEAQEEWRQYAKRIQHYFAANAVTDTERKHAIFLSEDLQVIKQFDSPEQAQKEGIR